MQPRWRHSIALLGLAALGYLGWRYQRDKQRAVRAFRAGAQVAYTRVGEVEYAVEGHGPPVLILHGGGGGYDQGLWLGHQLALAGYQRIALSRPGHRRTPLATGYTPTAQAQAACALLDHLAIESAVVIAFSAGGFNALEFAINHPERCRGLVLLSAHGPALRVFPPAPYWLWLLPLLMSSDVPGWLMQGRLASPLMRSMFPASDHRAGLNNDFKNVLQHPPLAISSIRVPTLLLHGTRDPFVPYPVALNTAHRIPGAQLVTVPMGNHFIVATHADLVRNAVQAFLATCCAVSSGKA